MTEPRLVFLYLDTSAWAKAFVHEPEHFETIELISKANGLITSTLSYVEIFSVLTRASRANKLAASDLLEAARLVNVDWEGFIKIPPEQILIERAAKLATTFALRGYDAVHLASAENARAAYGQALIFAVFDKPLRAAAIKRNLTVWPR